mgnify:CR=1 FL=1
MSEPKVSPVDALLIINFLNARSAASSSGEGESAPVDAGQPAIGLAFRAELAGRALSAYNLVVFLGVFVVQWGIGLVIDLLRANGWNSLSAYRGALALLAGCCTLSYVWFLRLEERATPHKTASSL